MIETRQDLEALDRADDLREFRAQFELPPDVIYLDGNSLGALPRRTRERVAGVVEREWGRDLIKSWNTADWISMPQRTGDKIAALIGAGKGEVVAADSTSVNLFSHLIVSEKTNFPTDLYVAQGLIAQLGGDLELLLVDGTDEALEAVLAERGAQIGVVLLTHIHYTTARMYDMRRVTAAAHNAGAVIVWDLSHSAGIAPIDLHGCDADFAVGCGYKHLNGGPGAPAFIYVARRYHERFMQPISGWMGDARPFEFLPGYEPAAGISRYLSGTPPVIAMAALEASVELILEAPMEAIRRKSIALCDVFIALMDRHCADSALELISPRDGAWRGSHLSYRHEASYPIMQALIRSGIIGDCRPPDLMRFGFAPLYLRYVDLWDAVMRIAEVLRTREWDRAEFRSRQSVT